MQHHNCTNENMVVFFKSQNFIIYAQLIKFPYKQHILWVPFTVVHHRFACTWFLLLAGELFQTVFFHSFSCLNLVCFDVLKNKRIHWAREKKNIHTMHCFLSLPLRLCNLRVIWFFYVWLGLLMCTCVYVKFWFVLVCVHEYLWLILH